MCRMFGVVSAGPVQPSELLDRLRGLSVAHPDGWGIAVRTDDAWGLHRGTACAAPCPRYGALVDQIAGQLIVAHVRQKTVGETCLANTHPFVRDSFVFAHNGTVRDVAALD